MLLDEDGGGGQRAEQRVEHVAENGLENGGLGAVDEVDERGGGDETHADGLVGVEEREDGGERGDGELVLQEGLEIGGELTETADGGVADARMGVLEGGDDVLRDLPALRVVGDDLADLAERVHDGVAVAPVGVVHGLVDERVERREQHAAADGLADARQHAERVVEHGGLRLVGLGLVLLPGVGGVGVDVDEDGEEDLEERS